VHNRCYFENGRVAALKGLFNVRNNNKLIIFLDILTQNMLKEVMSVFSFYIFRTSFKLENDYFDVIVFPWCFDVTLKFHNSVPSQMLIS